MRYILILTLLSLVGCKQECRVDTDQKARQEIFKACITIAAGARKGVNYTTHDDEDFDEVIEACGEEAFWQSKVRVCRKESGGE